MKKILMYGFGSGNNIEPWLDFFQHTRNQHTLCFICHHFDLDKQKYPDIEIIELLTYSPFRTGLKRRLSKRKFDLIYIQGLYDYPIIFYLFFKIRTKIKVINIWNNTNYKKGTLKNKKFWQIPFYRLILRMADKIIFTWYGTYKEFTGFYPSQEHKLIVKPWGIRDKIINEHIGATHDFTKSFLSLLSEKDIFIFWPESLSPDEHIDKFLKALVNIPKTIPLSVLIFSGHQKEETDYVRYLKEIIHQNNLTFVKIKTGLYLPYQDIMALWQRADLSLKLSTKDQLSNGIIEALFFETPIFFNDWYPYRKLQEIGITTSFVRLNESDINQQILSYAANIGSDRLYYKDIGSKNKEIVKKYFNFDQNIMELISSLENLES